MKRKFIICKVQEARKEKAFSVLKEICRYIKNLILKWNKRFLRIAIRNNESKSKWTLLIEEKKKESKNHKIIITKEKWQNLRKIVQ